MLPNVIPYNPRLKNLAKELRQNMTIAEAYLWNALKSKQLSGYDFHRQRPIDEYIVDFFCRELSLVIEVDGCTHYHDEAIAADENRQRKLESLGLRFLRFDEQDVLHHYESVVHEIEDWLKSNGTRGD